MKKSTKGLIAAGAGIALLTGVGGTFAEWRESQDVPGGTVTAGHLDWTVATGAWNDITTGSSSPVAIATIADFRMVPGDILEYSTTITPDLVGDNLTATLTAEIAGATGTLVDDVTITAEVNDSGAATMQLTPADTTDIPVTVTVAMPFDLGGDGVAGDAGEDELLDLTSLTLDLVQNANP